MDPSLYSATTMVQNLAPSGPLPALDIWAEPSISNTVFTDLHTVSTPLVASQCLQHDIFTLAEHLNLLYLA